MGEPSGAGEAIESLVGFSRLLKAEGLTVGTKRVVTYCQAVAALGPSSLDDLYWAGRLTLVGRREETPAYDRAFDAYFRGRRSDAPDRSTPFALKLSLEAGLPAGGSPGTDGDAREHAGPGRALAFTAASPTEILRRKSFEAYSEEEHARARTLIARLATRVPQRRSRRTRPSRRVGPRPDLPRTLRRALRTEGEPLERSWHRRRTRRRRLVLLLDISGSMGAYARSLAQFAHAAVRAGHDVEAFAFGTRLTRITPALSSRHPDAALAALGAAVPDWQGGTRIGDSLKELLDRWGRRGPIRRALVVMLSDGLERGDPETLAAQMRRLARLAHRVVWVNPLKGSPQYEPLARGMAAALPHIDVFLPGHNLASLEALAEVLAQSLSRNS